MSLFLAMLLSPMLDVASAQTTPAVEAPAQEGDLRYEALLRPEYLSGFPVLVPIRVWNVGNEIQSAPDIDRRPWLVEFTLDQGRGERDRRRTTPPTTDPGRTVRVAPRGQRRTLLEIPSSSKLRPGEYSLDVSLDPDTLKKRLAQSTITIAVPTPVDGDLSIGTSAITRSALESVWLHDAVEGYDLYLQVAPPGRPDLLGNAQWLAHLDTRVSPSLSEAAGGSGGTRHVVWPVDKRGIGYTTIEQEGVAATASTVTLPWPEVELVGRAATDLQGDLHVPVWIPAPKAPRGEVRIVTIGARGQVSFRRAALFDQRPVAVATTVDDSGTVQLLVATATTIDNFSVRGVSTGEALPLPGKRIHKVPAGHTLVDARFGLLDASADHAGGLAVLVTTQHESQLHSTWLGTRGTAIHSLTPTPLPEGARLEAILPAPTPDSVGLLLSTGQRTARYLEAGATADLTTSLHGDWALARHRDGKPYIRRLVKSGPIDADPIPLK